MSKKTGQRKHDDVDDDENQDDPGGMGLDERFRERDIPEPGYRGKLNQFLTLAQHNANKAVFYLYKIVRGKKAILSKYFSESDIPDEHETGLKWGSGDYDLMMTCPSLRKGGKSIITSYLFTLDAYYDELRLKNNQNSPMYQQQHFQQPDNGRSLMDAVTLLQSLIGTLAPLIRPVESGTPDVQKLFSSNYDVLAKVMRQSMENSVDLMNDYQRKVLMLKESKENPVEGDEETIVEKLIPYVKDWLPLLIGGGAQARQVAQVAKSTELFKEISKNRKITNALIAYLDKDKGADATNAILKSLNLKRGKAPAETIK